MMFVHRDAQNVLLAEAQKVRRLFDGIVALWLKRE
jgi:hypothetical protein